jgi:hypothetical protein
MSSKNQEKEKGNEFSPLFFNIVLKFLASTIRQEYKIKEKENQ